eukprot:COSAG01_NODE_8796_length_2656_cov_4.895190_4_plen_70_part_01
MHPRRRGHDIAAAAAAASYWRAVRALPQARRPNVRAEMTDRRRRRRRRRSGLATHFCPAAQLPALEAALA